MGIPIKVEVMVMDNSYGKKPIADLKRGPGRRSCPFRELMRSSIHGTMDRACPRGKGSFDAVRLKITKDGKTTRINVPLRTFLGPKYDHLGSVEFRKALIYGKTHKLKAGTAAPKHGNYVFDVQWRWTRATAGFKGMVVKKKAAYKKRHALASNIVHAIKIMRENARPADQRRKLRAFFQKLPLAQRVDLRLKILDAKRSATRGSSAEIQLTTLNKEITASITARR